MKKMNLSEQVIDLHYTVTFYCRKIRQSVCWSDAVDLKTVAIDMILENGEISEEMLRFLKRKVFASMVEGGFKDSGNCRAFSRKISKRYSQIFY